MRVCILVFAWVVLRVEDRGNKRVAQKRGWKLMVNTNLSECVTW